jgi:hypothetical protein
MGEIKKYTDIVRLGHKMTVGVLSPGDHITITEKLDGANSSFVPIEFGVDCFSRNIQVTPDNTLRGYYGWIQENIVSIKEKLNPKYRYFGEWLIPHKIVYKPEYYNNFYLFNVYDEELGKYLSDNIMRSEAARLGIKTVPLIYEGEYISFEHLMSFVGQSEMAVDYGEGVVVKNVDYKDRYGHQVFVKLVHEDFAEIQKQKKPKDPSVITQEQVFVNTYLVEARVDKMLHKLVDEDILDENFGIEDMGTILKNLNVRLYDDLLKEESDYLPAEYENKLLRKAIGGKLPKIVKQILNN